MISVYFVYKDAKKVKIPVKSTFTRNAIKRYGCIKLIKHTNTNMQQTDWYQTEHSPMPWRRTRGWKKISSCCGCMESRIEPPMTDKAPNETPSAMVLDKWR